MECDIHLFLNNEKAIHEKQRKQINNAVYFKYVCKHYDIYVCKYYDHGRCTLTPPKTSLTDILVFEPSLLVQVDQKLGHYLFSHVTDVCFIDQKPISNSARNIEK